MIAVLDANILMKDFPCAGNVWQALAHAPDTWSLRLVTSEVAVAETVAGYERQVLEAVAGVAKMTSSWWRFGAMSEVEDFQVRMRERVANYQQDLTSSLEAAGVETLQPPAIAHMDVVTRSVARRRPCDSEGNGYPDTLVWLTVLDLVRRTPPIKWSW